VLSSSRTGGRTFTHPGVDGEVPRDGGALLLPSAQVYAPLANQRRVPIGEGLDEPACRRWKMTMDKIRTFTFPSSAAPETPSATSCATLCAMSFIASFTCSSFTCRPRALLAPPTPN